MFLFNKVMSQISKHLNDFESVNKLRLSKISIHRSYTATFKDILKILEKLVILSQYSEYSILPKVNS